MKYEFIKIDDDTTKFKYKNKEFTFKKTVGLIEKLQKINFNAKMSMMKELKDKGMTANDLIITRKEGNKTIEDRSNLIELEQYFVGLESESLYDEIIKDATGMSFAELLVDMDIDYNNKDDLLAFMTQLTKAITPTGKSPSEKEQDVI